LPNIFLRSAFAAVLPQPLRASARDGGSGGNG